MASWSYITQIYTLYAFIPFCSIGFFGSLMNTTILSTSPATEIMNTKSIWTTYCPDCTQECIFSDFIIKSTSLLASPEFLMNDIQSSFISLEVAYETTRTEIYSQQATITV
ncbi:unnamed protein product [Adineta steineri]|uniref:Uncharacterized protein n=1 Tax=Adineta steineri TaxID=433720 RepID=A0A815F272_9BILA|nr:unnamed protein product [Adineta steineri]